MIFKLFKYIIGFLILIAIQLVCNSIVKIFHLLLPAPILGIIVFTVLLQMKIIKKEWVKDICELALNYMPLLFIPLTVGIVVYYSLIEKNLLPIFVNVIFTAILTLVITAFFVENIIKYVRLKKMKEMNND